MVRFGYTPLLLFICVTHTTCQFYGKLILIVFNMVEKLLWIGFCLINMRSYIRCITWPTYVSKHCLKGKNQLYRRKNMSLINFLHLWEHTVKLFTYFFYIFRLFFRPSTVSSNAQTTLWRHTEAQKSHNQSQTEPGHRIDEAHCSASLSMGKS